MIVVDQAVIARLKAVPAIVTATPGGIHNGPANEDDVPPMIEVIAMPSVPYYTFRATAWETCGYTVTGVGAETAGKGAQQVAEELRDAAVAALTDFSGGTWALTVSGHKVMRVWRDRNLAPFPRTVAGVRWVYAEAYINVQVTRIP